ncbi:MAG: ParB/Srx family N-terminal domain-containing protein [Acinetobacter populi]|jgi:hypothetical protein|uniref:ParB/Srx family N-terminal domain-containing protein n=1 Tax=Acinetobacter populi TaxID=1582270 RepID=UPI002353E6E6|nr:ParB/Srx family N-terminal domain-containing protein [Acinetobacter populi]MCH4246495.1 ParB/Srx family N-terminal domain-containing protein [Acinetobacter populi]
MKHQAFKMLSLTVALSCFIGLAGCNDSNDDQEQTVVTPEQPVDTRDQRFLDAKTDDVLEVSISDLNPTQGAIGYDQIYYKLGRWQGDWERTTWLSNDAQELDYLNKTVGKKFSDYCEDMGGVEGKNFETIDALKNAKLSDPSTFACKEQLGSQIASLKTVVVGYDGKLYLTDGHHTMTEFLELPDGGKDLKVFVRVAGNYSNSTTADEFWAKMVSNGQAWLKNGANETITYSQLPKNLGLKSTSNPDGMENDPYRSLVYFTRDIGYSKVDGAADFAEFLWEDWFHKQIEAGSVPALSDFHLDINQYSIEEILAETSIKKTLLLSGSATGYQAAVANYSILMGSTQPIDIIYGDKTAQDMGALDINTTRDSDDFNDLVRTDVKKDGSPRTGGKIWYAIKYQKCGVPQDQVSRACWGW